MSVFMDTTTGMGLAGATGVRPYLPPLLAGGLARGDTGIDFDGTDWRFLESTWFLLAVLVLGVIAYVAERSEANRRFVELFSGVAGVILGALLFAGALADGGSESWPGLIGGAICAALGWQAVGGLIERARTRLKDDAAALFTAYADGVALLLAAIAIFLPPVSILAILGFIVLLLAGRRREGEKYAGLRVLR
jgi:asparagine N-glycosylation enzyme membrane subunit Stt3